MLPAILKSVRLDLINEFTCGIIKNMFNLNVNEKDILHCLELIKNSNENIKTIGDLMEHVTTEDIMAMATHLKSNQDAQVALKGENMCACPECGHINRLDKYMPKYFGKES